MSHQQRVFLNYGKQWINDVDIQAVVDVLKSDYLTQGPKIKEFEDKICEMTGAKYCVVVANGTAALHLAVAALKIENGSEGITSPNTFIATSNSLIYSGLKPIFADIDNKTYCIDPEKIKGKITENTRLIIPVHFAGQPCDMKKIHQIANHDARAKSHKLFIIEDASHAIGSQYADGSYVGNCKYSDMTTFSFHPVKTITTGEGGAITTNNRELYERLLLLRNHGITKDNSKFSIEHSKLGEPWYYEMQELGFNYRMTDMQAALGLSQIKRLTEFKQRRREIVAYYNQSFKDIDWLRIPYEAENLCSCFHLYVIQIDFEKIGKTRKEVMKYLLNKKIGTQVHYIPVHTQPYYQQNYGYKWGDYPISEEYYEKALSIPIYPKMTDEDVKYVIENILELGN
jgi:UDP-4-amino-4,6-dideoxy-N-acetyl-beta-L-altrosamine transaminase